MSIDDLIGLGDDSPDDDQQPDPAPASDTTLGPDVHSALLALQRALPRSLRRRLRLRLSTALVIIAPSPDWALPLQWAAHTITGAGWEVEHESTRGRTSVNTALVYFVRDAADRSGRPDKSGRLLPDLLARGGTAIGIAPDPSFLPQHLLDAADATIQIRALTGRDLAKVVRTTTLAKRCPRIDDALASALTPLHIAMAVRRHSTPGACVQRLQNFVSRPVGDALDDIPKLEDLAGYGEALAWGLSLKADIDRRRADPSSVSIDIITRSLLLAGPPGTGKTLFASALAKSCGIPLIVSSYADWQASGTGHLGDVMTALRACFAGAKSAAQKSGVGAVLLLDEIDSIPSRASTARNDHADWWTSIQNALLTLTEQKSPSRTGVILIAATNFADRLDPAFTRSGRLDRKIMLALPGPDDLAAMLRTHLGSDLPGQDLRALVRLAAGMTGADVARIVRDARQRARDAGRDLTHDHLVTGLLPPETRPHSAILRTARHEAAHAVVGLALGVQHLESVSLHTPHGEGVARFSTPDYAPQTRANLEAVVIMGLAGRAADALFGDADLGASSDLAMATHILGVLHASGGLGGSLVSLAKEDEGAVVLQHDRSLRAAVDGDLTALYARAQELVAAHRLQIEMVAAALVKRRFLSGDDVRAILARMRRADATRLIITGGINDGL